MKPTPVRRILWVIAILVALVAGDARAHFVVPGLGGGDEQRAVRGRTRQPVACEQLGAARLAAFLPAQDEFAARNAGVHAPSPPSRYATARGLEANHAWK